MLEQLKYINHFGEEFEFGKDGIYVNANDLHDYDWDVKKKGNRISTLSRKVVNRKLPVVILCDTEEKGIAARNRLYEVFEKDVLAMQPGRIVIGDYFFVCYATKSAKKEYLFNGKYMKVSLTLTSDQPYWVREFQTSFTETGGTSADGVDYPHNYPYDYSTEITNSTIINTDFVPSNFSMIIYGAVTNPVINIGSHTYQVNCEIDSGEHLIIDSIKKTIQLVTASGDVINKFNDRSRESYIFEKIPSGETSVTWDGSFGFDIILKEERSEPKWI